MTATGALRLPRRRHIHTLTEYSRDIPVTLTGRSTLTSPLSGYVRS